MKKTIIIAIIFLIVMQQVTAIKLIKNIQNTSITPTISAKLKTYADTNFKPYLKYSAMQFTEYKRNGNIIVVYAAIDGKNIRWILNYNRFSQIIQ